MLRNTAAKYGHLHALQYAIGKGYSLNFRKVCDTAAKYGHLHILQSYLEEYGPFWDEWTCVLCQYRGTWIYK